MPGLRLRPDVVGTADGLAHGAIRPRVASDPGRVHDRRAAHRRRSAATTAPCRIPTRSASAPTGSICTRPPAANRTSTSSCPFQIPLGALVPRAAREPVAARKNIGTTHITNGAYRLHPVEWNIGEAAGHARRVLRGTVNDAPRRARVGGAARRLQRELVACGVELSWPDEVRAY